MEKIVKRLGTAKVIFCKRCKGLGWYMDIENGIPVRRECPDCDGRGYFQVK